MSSYNPAEQMARINEKLRKAGRKPMFDLDKPKYGDIPLPRETGESRDTFAPKTPGINLPIRRDTEENYAGRPGDFFTDRLQSLDEEIFPKLREKGKFWDTLLDWTADPVLAGVDTLWSSYARPTFGMAGAIAEKLPEYKREVYQPQVKERWEPDAYVDTDYKAFGFIPLPEQLKEKGTLARTVWDIGGAIPNFINALTVLPRGIKEAKEKGLDLGELWKGGYEAFEDLPSRAQTASYFADPLDVVSGGLGKLTDVTKLAKGGKAAEILSKIPGTEARHVGRFVNPLTDVGEALKSAEDVGLKTAGKVTWNPKTWDNLFRLTPESKALEATYNTLDLVGNEMQLQTDARKVVDAFEKWADAERVMNAPERSARSMVGQQAHYLLGDMKGRGEFWLELYEKGRGAWDELAQRAKEMGTDLDGLIKMADTKEAPAEIQKAVKALKGIPRNVDEMRANLLMEMAEGAGNKAIEYFGGQNVGYFTQLMNIMKTGQSYLFLTTNPTYVLNNVMNNFATALVHGVPGYRNAPKLLERMQISPVRLKAGIGAADIPGYEKLGEAAKRAQQTIRKGYGEPTEAAGKLSGLKETVEKGQNTPLAAVGKLAQKMESIQGEQVFAAGIVKAWNKFWQFGKAIPPMSPGLQEALAQVTLPSGRTALDYVTSAIKAGKNPNEIIDALYTGSAKAAESALHRIADITPTDIEILTGNMSELLERLDKATDPHAELSKIMGEMANERSALAKEVAELQKQFDIKRMEGNLEGGAFSIWNNVYEELNHAFATRDNLMNKYWGTGKKADISWEIVRNLVDETLQAAFQKNDARIELIDQFLRQKYDTKGWFVRADEVTKRRKAVLAEVRKIDLKDPELFEKQAALWDEYFAWYDTTHNAALGEMLTGFTKKDPRVAEIIGQIVDADRVTREQSRAITKNAWEAARQAGRPEERAAIHAQRQNQLAQLFEQRNKTFQDLTSQLAVGVKGAPEVAPVKTADELLGARRPDLRPIPESGSGAGWKLHLGTDNPEQVSAKLKEMGYRHKVGKNAGQEGKDLTVYIGSRSDAARAAERIESELHDLLKPAAGDALVDDIPFTDRVWGRFEITHIDKDFHQYGGQGIPFLKDDMQNRLFGGAFDPAEAQRRAEAILKQRYGSFFTGNPADDMVQGAARSADELLGAVDEVAEPARAVEEALDPRALGDKLDEVVMAGDDYERFLNQRMESNAALETIRWFRDEPAFMKLWGQVGGKRGEDIKVDMSKWGFSGKHGGQVPFRDVDWAAEFSSQPWWQYTLNMNPHLSNSSGDLIQAVLDEYTRLKNLVDEGFKPPKPELINGFDPLTVKILRDMYAVPDEVLRTKTPEWMKAAEKKLGELFDATRDVQDDELYRQIQEIRDGVWGPKERVAKAAKPVEAATEALESLHDISYPNLSLDTTEFAMNIAEIVGRVLPKVADEMIMTPRGILQGLPPELAGMLKKYITDDLSPAMADARIASMKLGEYWRDQAMLNYSRRYGYNQILGYIFPYEFWYTTSLGHWAKKFMKQPALLATYARMKRDLEEKSAELPSRMRGMVELELPFLPDWMGSYFFDPLSIGLPLENFLYGPQSLEWDTEKQRLTKELEYARKSNAPQVQIDELERRIAELPGRNMTDYMAAFTSPGLQWQLGAKLLGIDKKPLYPLSPGSRFLKSVDAVRRLATGNEEPAFDLSQRVRHATNQLLGTNLPETDQWDTYRIRRMLSNMSADGTVTPDEAERAMIEMEGPVWEKAKARADQERAVGVTPFADAVFPKGEESQRRISEIRSRLYQSKPQEGTPEYDEWKKIEGAFYDAFPQFQTRQLSFDLPDTRYYEYLKNAIWDARNENKLLVKALYNAGYKDDLDAHYKETADFDQLARLANALGIKLPKMGEAPVGEPKPSFTGTPEYKAGKQVPEIDEDMVATYAGYLKEVERRFGKNITNIQSGYFDSDDKQYRRDYLRKHPELKKYWDFKDDFVRRNPELAKIAWPDSAEKTTQSQELVRQAARYRPWQKWLS